MLGVRPHRAIGVFLNFVRQRRPRQPDVCGPVDSVSRFSSILALPGLNAQVSGAPRIEVRPLSAVKVAYVARR